MEHMTHNELLQSLWRSKLKLCYRIRVQWGKTLWWPMERGDWGVWQEMK